MVETFPDQFGIYGVCCNFGVKNEGYLCCHGLPVPTCVSVACVMFRAFFNASTKPSYELKQNPYEANLTVL